jgi:ABC-type multidrug transport system fused ATPase/permease subunit
MKMLIIIWDFLDGPMRRRLIALQLVAMLMAVSTVSGIAAVLPFFTVLAAPKVIHRTPALDFIYARLHFDTERTFVIALGLGFAAVVVLANAINLAGSLALHRFAHRVGDDFHVALFDEYLRRDYAFHATTHSSLLADNVIYETGRVTGGIIQGALRCVANLATVVCIVVTALLLDPRVAACAISSLGASYAAFYVAVRGRLLHNGLEESRYFARRTRIVHESFAAIKEIIGWQAYGTFVRQFAQCCQPISDSLVSTHAISQSPRYVLEIAMVCGLVVAALYLSGGREGGGNWMAQLSFIALAAYRILPALQQAFAAIVQIRADRPAFERIAADLLMAKTRRLHQVSAAAAAGSSDVSKFPAAAGLADNASSPAVACLTEDASWATDAGPIVGASFPADADPADDASSPAVAGLAAGASRATVVGPIVGAIFPVATGPADAMSVGRPRREIRLDRVSYYYAANRPPAISHLSLCIPAGSTVGLLGANGSGKTTVANVLAGLLSPQSGHMEVDGIVLGADLESWRSTVAYIPQHTVLLDATLAENIAFGVARSMVNWERLREAVHLARLEDCMRALPLQYEEMLGEGGRQLSGGQRQRMGIARALYRDASVLIVDEGTSSLDAKAETAIVDLLASLGPNRTIVMIAHRLSSLRHCDMLFELQGGRMVRSGTYRELNSSMTVPARDVNGNRYTTH